MSDLVEWTHAKRGRRGWGEESWPEGPWTKEPDKRQWVDDATGLDCLMHRNGSGAWCGYVGVPEGHPLFARDYEHADVSVHGGLTYSAFCQDTKDESEGICHVPLPGRPHKVWWLGFDCAHYNDLSPGMVSFNEKFDREHPEFAGVRRETYRDVQWVEAEVTQLAAQLAAMTLDSSSEQQQVQPTQTGEI